MKDANEKSFARFRVWSAWLLLITGLALAIAGFIVPPTGVIDETVLWFFANCCIYAAGMLGIPVFMNSTITRRLEDFARRFGLKPEEGAETPSDDGTA